MPSNPNISLENTHPQQILGLLYAPFAHSSLECNQRGRLRSELVSKSPLRLLPLLLGIITLSGCNGFFINPKLKDITVTPATPSVSVGSTQQMTATGTYDDGSTKDITVSVSWSSDNNAVFSISSTGLVKGNQPGTASVTATSATISGSTTVTITVANLSSIDVTPTNSSILSSQTQQYKAIGTLDDGTQADITDSVTWNSSNTSVAAISSGGLATAQGTGTTYIVATSGSITSNTATLAVN